MLPRIFTEAVYFFAATAFNLRMLIDILTHCKELDILNVHFTKKDSSVSDMR